MNTPPLHTLLEVDKVSALLANFTQLFSEPVHTWLAEAGGHLVGYYPVAAQDVDARELHVALERVRRFGRSTPVPIGIATPVWLRGETVGALIVTASDEFDSSKATVLQLLGRVISLLAEDSLTREDLLSETLDRYRELNLLFRSSETIAAGLDLAHVNRVVLDESTRLVLADEGTIMLRDRETEKLTVWASYGLDAVTDIGSGIPLGHELAERVMCSGKAELVERPETASRTKPLGAVLCVPLKTKEQALGVISLAHTDPERSFRPNEISLISALAGQAAIAIENAEMFSDLSALHSELEAANRRLRELDKLKSSFLGVITHELRSPFANIDFCMQVIERYGLDGWPQPQREQWGHLVRDVKEAKGMIDNLVSFAVLLREQGELHLSDVDFNKLVNDVVQTLAPFARTRRLQLSVDGADTMPLIRADERRLGEAVYHLIHNAIKFNRPAGTIEVRYWSGDDGIRFEVQDTGVGIPAGRIEELWDPFSQLADPLKRGREGLGLGLALVRYVVRAHGGRVSVSSRDDVGSTFRFWMPIRGPRGVPDQASDA